MRRDFSTRKELAGYLRAAFPEAAARDGAVSPIRGGKAAAEKQLHLLRPLNYGPTRNFLNGAVSRLSPYIRHGVLPLPQVRDYVVSLVPTRQSVVKFLSELAWRDYWQRLYARWGSGVWLDREDYKTGFPASAYGENLPGDLAASETGLACMDTFSRELRETGYLHNHARMWLAAYVVHWRRVRWQAGAQWFLTHLLDGDPASNNLSWQWVASTFSNKPYFFNRENLERYSGGVYCRSCGNRESCPFEDSYESLEKRLFRIGGAK